MIPGVRHAVFAAGKGADGTFGTLESWPESIDVQQAVLSVLEAAIASESAEVRKNDPAGGASDTPTWIVACPLRRGGGVCGAVAVEVGGIDESQVPVITRLMLWGSAWPTFLADQDLTRHDRPGHPALNVVGAALEPQKLSAATAAAATALAREYEADSAAIGLLDRNMMRLVAMSGRAVFDRRSDAVRAIEHALEEALDQSATVVFPAPLAAPPLVTDAHERMVRHERCTCTVLLRADGKITGGLSLSRPRSGSFDQAEIGRLEELARILGPALEARRLAEQGVLSRASAIVSGFAGRLVGAGNLRLKTMALGLVGLFVFLNFATGTYQVSAPAVLEGAIERDLVAPTNGFVAEARVRAGTRVRAGEILAMLDDRPLRLERGRLEGQRDELTNEYNRALGALDHGGTRVLAAQIKQAESQLALVEGELSRTRIVAPFDGLIVSGDLSQSLGSPVSRGDLLFRLAPLEGFRVILEVEEGDVPAIQTGAQGQLMLAALPRERFDVRVERTNGMARSADGRNVLEVETTLVGESANLRPGMKGVVRVEAGRARLLWIWAHRFVERVQLWWWAWSPVA